MATFYSHDAKPSTSYWPISVERFKCIFRTRRRKPATGTEQWRNQIAITKDQKFQRYNRKRRNPSSMAFVIISNLHANIGPRAISTKSLPDAACTGNIAAAAARMRLFARLRTTAPPKRLVAVKPIPISPPADSASCEAEKTLDGRGMDCITNTLATNFRPRAALRNSARFRNCTSLQTRFALSSNLPEVRRTNACARVHDAH